MAGTDKDLEAGEKPWQKERRMIQHDINRGSRFPPFAIEHMPLERQRLSGRGMTDEDRALRRQWLKDQELSPNEPRNIPELKPRNIVKRILAKPWDIFFDGIRPIVGANVSEAGRFLVPKALLLMTGVWYTYYHIKYNPKTWERSGGWLVWKSRETLLSGDPLPPRAHDDFMDLGFKSRTARRDLS